MKKEKKVPSIYYTVINLLDANERCRNDDQYLICKVWLALYPTRFIHTEIGGEKLITVPLIHIANDFTSFESIRRTRQKIQNDLGLYPPTKMSVAKARRIKEEVWRENCSNNFTKEQNMAIMEIYMRAKNATGRNLAEIKQRVIAKYGI